MWCSTTEQLLTAAAEAEGFHFSVETRAVVVEDFGGLLDVSPGALEGLRDGFAFNLVYRHIRWDDAAILAVLRTVKLFR